MARFKYFSFEALGEWLVALLVAANLLWTTLCLGGYRPETMTVSWALTGAALSLHLGIAAWTRQRPHPAGLWLLPFVAYAAFNVAAVSPVAWLGWRDWLGWAQMIAMFWLMINALKRRGPRVVVLGTLVVLGAIAVLLAAYQRFVTPDWLPLGRTQADQFIGRSSGPFGIPNTLAAFLLLLIPPMLALTWQRGTEVVSRVFWGYLAAVFLFGLGLTISRGAWLSLALALIAWPLCARNLNWTTRFILAATALAAAMLIGLVLYSSVPRVKQRFDAMVADAGERSRPILWEVSLKLFAEAPVLGTGGGSYNTLFERHRPEGFRDEPQWAHNDYLNTLSDYGALGFLLFFGAATAVAILAASNRARQSTIATRALTGWEADSVTNALGIGLGAFALSLFVDFHFKIPALAMAVAVLAGELVQRSWLVQSDQRAGIKLQVGLLATSLAVALFTLGVVLPIYRAEAARYAGRQAIDRLAMNPNPSLNEHRQTLTSAAVAFSDAVALDSSNAQAWADRAYVTELWAHLAPSRMNELGKEAEQAAKEALDRSLDVPEFWIRRGVALDMQNRWAEADEAFVKAVELARFNSINWYYLAYHQSLNPKYKEKVIISIENCLRLDPGNRLAVALHYRLTNSVR
jgi:tetratricopeptide (TPR) repeat protein